MSKKIIKLLQLENLSYQSFFNFLDKSFLLLEPTKIIFSFMSQTDLLAVTKRFPLSEMKSNFEASVHPIKSTKTEKMDAIAF